MGIFSSSQQLHDSFDYITNKEFSTWQSIIRYITNTLLLEKQHHKLTLFYLYFFNRVREIITVKITLQSTIWNFKTKYYNHWKETICFPVHRLNNTTSFHIMFQVLFKQNHIKYILNIFSKTEVSRLLNASFMVTVQWY